MTDEGEIKSGQIEEAACRPPRQRAAFPASKYACTQSIPLLRNLQFARWMLKNAYTTHVHVSMFKGNLESEGDREERERQRENREAGLWSNICSHKSRVCFCVSQSMFLPILFPWRGKLMMTQQEVPAHWVLPSVDSCLLSTNTTQLEGEAGRVNNNNNN